MEYHTRLLLGKTMHLIRRNNLGGEQKGVEESMFSSVKEGINVS